MPAKSPVPPTKTSRLLDLIAFLAPRRRPVSIDEVMEAVPDYAHRWFEGTETARDSVRRKFERDKDELRALGVPIETAPLPGQSRGGTFEGYRLSRRDFYLPYLRLLGDLPMSEGSVGTPASRSLAGLPEPFELTEEEAAAALDGLRHLADLPEFPLMREARSAYGKLTFDLDPGRFRTTPVSFSPIPSHSDVREHLHLLFEARAGRKRVRFRYQGIRRGAPTERDVAPYGFLYQGGHWYVIGHDALRDAVRTFRVSRMEQVEVDGAAPKAAEYEIPEDFDLRTYAGRKAWELGDDENEPIAARVFFRYPASIGVERNGLGRPADANLGRGAARDFQVRDPEAFVRWILGFEGKAEIVAPEELRADVEEMAERVARSHREVKHA